MIVIVLHLTHKISIVPFGTLMVFSPTFSPELKLWAIVMLSPTGVAYGTFKTRAKEISILDLTL